LVGPPGGLEKFWETNINHPGMEGHPALVDLHKTLPLAMHGDGVPITGLGKIWSKLLGYILGRAYCQMLPPKISKCSLAWFGIHCKGPTQ